jgi:hypothetical protein
MSTQTQATIESSLIADKTLTASGDIVNAQKAIELLNQRF